MKASATLPRTSNSRKLQPVRQSAIDRMMTRDLHAHLLRDATDVLLKRCNDTGIDVDNLDQMEDAIASALPIGQMLDIVKYFSGAIERQVCRATAIHATRFQAITLAHQAGLLSETIQNLPAIFPAKS